MAVLAFGAAPAAAQTTEAFAPYDGSNPFNCDLQDVGTGTDFPDPDADPFCVEYEKTNQNLTDFGIVDFLAQEPARVAAATPKCFYYQRDHWTGWVVQDQPPELWHWDGAYFFDKAKGTGGISVRNFRLAGEPADMTPFVPSEYRPYFDPSGGGGVRMVLETDPDPRCAALAEREDVYANRPHFGDCIPPGGELRGRSVGLTRLGMRRRRVRERLGAPSESDRRVDRWCLVGDADLRIVYRGNANRTALIRTSSRGHAARGVASGDRASKAKRKLRLGEGFRRADGVRVLESSRPGVRRSLFAALARKRVRWLAIADPKRLKGRRAERRAIRATG